MAGNLAHSMETRLVARLVGSTAPHLVCHWDARTADYSGFHWALPTADPMAAVMAVYLVPHLGYSMAVLGAGLTVNKSDHWMAHWMGLRKECRWVHRVADRLE